MLLNALKCPNVNIRHQNSTCRSETLSPAGGRAVRRDANTGPIIPKLGMIGQPLQFYKYFRAVGLDKYALLAIFIVATQFQILSLTQHRHRALCHPPCTYAK